MDEEIVGEDVGEEPYESEEEWREQLRGDMEGLEKLTRLLTEEPEKMPKEIKHNFWGFHNRQVKITNLSEKQVWTKINQFDMAKNMRIMSLPRFAITPEYLLDLINARASYEDSVNRSVGGFERQQLNTQIQERHVVTSGEEYQRASGWFKKAGAKLFGRFRR